MTAANRTPTMRERKQRATRERLLTVTQTLFAERGYEGTTMDHIAAAADVSRATAFNYFPRKEELLLALVDRRRQIIVDLLTREQPDALDVADRLRRAFLSLCDTLDTDPAGNRALTRAWVQAGGPLLPDAFATAAVFAGPLRDAQARGQLRPDIDPGGAGQVLLDCYLGALIRWAAGQDDSTAPLREQFTAILDTLVNGLRA